MVASPPSIKSHCGSVKTFACFQLDRTNFAFAWFHMTGLILLLKMRKLWIICLSVCVRPPVCLSIYLSIYLPIYLSLSIYLSISLSICLSICPSVCLFVCPSIHFYLPISVCLYNLVWHFSRGLPVTGFRSP
jgi:hypothetical protein